MVESGGRDRDRDREASEDGPRQQLTRFLLQEARQAGLGSRDIADGLLTAKKVSAARVAGTDSPDPLAKIHCSNSHVDRLLKGLTPVPSWPFTREFLRITSRAAGLTAEDYRKRCEAARALLRAAAEDPAPVVPKTDADTATHAATHKDILAALRLEVELERARHAETRLRFALRDAQFLMTTLWFIISALRDIIADRDALLARAQHGAGDAERIARLRDETRQALTHKRTAETEADRAVARIRTLEGFWERARSDLRRLALHPDAADLTTAPTHGAGPAPALIPQEFLARPALDDIAGALAKAQALNASADDSARALEQTVGPTEHPGVDDEFVVLLAATKLPDESLRREAARSLVARWADRPETREALLHLIDDPGTLLVAIDGLAAACPGDREARAALLRLAKTTEHRVEVHRAVVRALSHGWPGDPESRDIYLAMATDRWDRPYAVEALAVAFPGDPWVRDHIVSLADSADAPSRSAVATALKEGWRGDESTLGCLVHLVADEEPKVRIAAVQAIGAGWPGDPGVRTVLMGLLKGSGHVDVTAEAATELLAGWPGDKETERALDELAYGLGAVKTLFIWLADEYSQTMGLPDTGRPQGHASA
ncbi:HEAT repeat domain-containing protein [Streptomyces sp. NPDC048258]|uniref:HEAT repeat domain-containing protein n=1 Tax=Streptomyces sp. NPDC048258 TaxID=3365527 RepID=UPI003718ED46